MDETPSLSPDTPLRLVVDPSLPTDEVRLHPAALCRIQEAFLYVDTMLAAGFLPANSLPGDNL